MPSANIPISDNFSINLSMGLGIGPNGIGAGANISGTYSCGDLSLTAGVGGTDNSTSWSGGFTYKDFSANYYRTTFGGSHAQTVGGIGLGYKNFSLRVENDLNIKGIGGDGNDR